MTPFHELEDWRIDWNSAARDAAGMTDDELIHHITQYEKLILQYKIKKEATETEAEKRNIRKPKFKLDRSTTLDSDQQYLVEKRAEKTAATKQDKLLLKLKSLGLTDAQARAQMATMLRQTEEKSK